MEVEIYTDGACSPNPGPGGWGAVLRYGEHEKDMYGGDIGPTTNNRMELMAPIMALESLTRTSTVNLYTDSTYVRNGITSWVHGWKANGWLTKAREPVKNADLWRRLEEAANRHEVEWHWVKGHAGHPENERADRLAVRGVEEVTGREVKQPQAKPKKPAKVKQPRELSGEPCGAPTKKGTPCPITAGANGLCHVHDPALQCGALTKKGMPCTIATGGGRCEYHQDSLELFS